jgi:DNA invertase Pin-like site-specific DNA recombinase
MSRQSTKITKKITALYPRVSREDSGLDESYSIINQKKLLTDIAKKMNLTNIKCYIDDGVTGTKLDRKNFTLMCEDIEKGLVGAVLVKDLSRLSRDQAQANELVEKFFPKHDIRFISIGDGIDSDNGEDEFLGFRTLMNEWYARDISKKRKLTNIVKNNAKEPLSLPPYGYMKDPDSKGWIIDPEAAEIVKRVFDLTLDGKGSYQIAEILTQERILTPMYYWLSKGFNRGGKKDHREPHFWSDSTIHNILSTQEYCGDIINLKTYSKSFKLKTRYDNPDKAIHKDVHEPIIDRAVFERIQQTRKKVRKRANRDGKINMFSGKMVCADCGFNLNYHFNQGNHSIEYFNCSGYNSRRGDCSSTHYIRVDFLEQVVLQEIRRLTKFATKHETRFAEIIMGYSQKADNDQRERKRKELYALNARDRELDKIFNRMYEDNLDGKIDDERFARMSKQYNDEQAELSGKIRSLSAELDKQESKTMTADVFISTVRQYTRAKKLTERMLNELVDRIEVYQSEKIDGVHVQRLNIHYNFVGTLEIPDIIEMPDITMLTRKGVHVTYSSSRKAG